MPRIFPPLRASISRFLRQDAGLATVDWVIICVGATGMAVAAMNMGTDTATTYSTVVRDEIQNPYFDTDWTSTVEIPPREEWEDRDPILIVVPTPDPTPEPEPEPVPDPVPEPEPEPEPVPEPQPEPDPDPTGGGPQIVTGIIPGCPSAAYIAQPLITTAARLVADGLEVDVTASGSTNIVSCNGLPGRGYFNANPTLTLDLSGFSDDLRRVEVTTNRSCDAEILLRDAQGNWYAGRRNADNRLRIEDDLANLNGLISIWVGMTYGGSCSGTEVEISAR